MGATLPTVALGNFTVKSIALGDAHSCAILSNNQVKCWGFGAELGLGDRVIRGDGPNEMGAALPFVSLGTGRTAKALTAGFEHTCALLDNNLVKCWGGFGGPLGQGDTEGRGDDPNEMGDKLLAVALGSG